MVPELSRRRTLQLAGSTVVAALAGCSRAVGRSTPRIDSTLGTTDYDPVLDDQPTPADGVPGVWGLIVAHPDIARKLVDWKALTPRSSTVVPGAEFRSFDPDAQFVSVVIGVLPTGYALKGYAPEPDSVLEDVVDDFRDRPVFVDGRLRYEVTPYRAFTPESGDPEYHYDYTFTLWHLNGHDRPDEIAVDFHPA